jgi:hypothetical protein
VERAADRAHDPRADGEGREVAVEREAPTPGDRGHRPSVYCRPRWHRRKEPARLGFLAIRSGRIASRIALSAAIWACCTKGARTERRERPEASAERVRVQLLTAILSSTSTSGTSSGVTTSWWKRRHRHVPGPEPVLDMRPGRVPRGACLLARLSAGEGTSSEGHAALAQRSTGEAGPAKMVARLRRTGSQVTPAREAPRGMGGRDAAPRAEV